MWKEFKPALRFLLIFVGLYFMGNLAYGFFIAMQGNMPDEITNLVAHQSAWILNNVFGYEVKAVLNLSGPTVFLKNGEHIVLDIYEGCNGVNVFIVFVAFIIAFNGHLKSRLWFIPVGILILHLSNLLRIVFLYWTAVHFNSYFYFMHKYIFTGIIYAVALVLWITWMYLLNDKKKIVHTE